MDLTLSIKITWKRIVVAGIILSLLFGAYTAGTQKQSADDYNIFLNGQTQGYIEGKSGMPLKASDSYNKDFFKAGYLVGYMYGYPFPALGEVKTVGVQPRIILMDFGNPAESTPQPTEQHGQNATTNKTNRE